MKKLINDPRHVVAEALEGLVDTTPGLALVESSGIILRHDDTPPADRRVAVISGGGSGHEPAHAGYVADGMLAAAVAGDIFTSPSVDAVLDAILLAAGPNGALLVVKNYTGDRLNFALAAELAIARGIPVEIVVVADDVALRDVVPRERRRGIAGVVLVHKVAGAAAAQGLPLAEVAALARRASAGLGTMGVALGPCTVPALGKPGFELGDDEIELGLGIHGEPGVGRETIRPADQLGEVLLDRIIADGVCATGDRVALLVNGLGGTPPLELAIMARHALAHARACGLVVERLYCGNYLTALEMAGCSISVMRLDDALLTALDAPTTSRAWGSDGRLPARQLRVDAPAVDEVIPDPTQGPQAEVMAAVTHAVTEALRAAATELGELDARSGDGDLGVSMLRGAEAIQSLPVAIFGTPSGALRAMADALRKAVAGSSGPFYAAALMSAARALEGNVDPAAKDWQQAFAAGVDAIEALGGARPGDRTMVDALRPAAQTWDEGLGSGLGGTNAFALAVEAARKGAAATADMHPRLGRASYLGERALGNPDAGAHAVVVWLGAIGVAIEEM